MRTRIAAFTASLLAVPFVTGCGGVKLTGAPSASQSPYSFSGDWGAYLAPGVNPASTPVDAFVGTLSASNGIVTGSLIPFPNSGVIGVACTTPFLTPISVTGSVDSNGNLIVTLPVSGGTATLTAALATNLETKASGSFKIVGGTCAMPSTPMQIAQYAPIIGTYTGTFFTTILPTGVQSNSLTTATAAITQSATPNSIGVFPVTGTVTLSGACVATFTLSNDAIVLGGLLEGPDTSGNYYFGGIADPTASSLQSDLTIQNSSPGCPLNSQNFLSGTLTRQ